MANTTPPHPADAYPGAPRWVKLAGIAVLLLVLVLGGLHLAGRGMGPGLHAPPASAR